MANTLRIRLLGTVQASFDDAPCAPFPTRKSILLFAWLVVHRPRPLDRSQTAGMLWPQVPEAAARRNLNTELWRLRQALGPAQPAIRADSNTLQFDPPFPVHVDAQELLALDVNWPAQRLGQAVELYSGDFLAGFGDDWVLELQERIRHQYLLGLERLVEVHAGAGDHRRAIAYGQRLLALDPLREAIHRQLIGLHSAHGDRVAAIRQYQQCVEALSRELGLSPMPETEALYRQLIRGTAEVAASNPPSPRLREAVFAGRAGERDRLGAQWEAAGRGQGKLVLIAGEAGMGKTRLAEEFIAGAGAGGTVLRARCSEAESASPYRPLADLLRAALKPPLLSRLDALSPAWRADLARLIPEAYDLWPGLQEADSLSPAQARERQEAALSESLLALASVDSPLLIFLDDLQWADPATLDLLSRLARQFPAAPAMLLATYRPETLALHAGHPLESWLGGLGGDGLLSLSLPPLSRDETLDWLWRMGGTQQPPERFADALFSETEGHPLFVLETLRHLFDSGTLSTDGDGTWSIPLHRQADDISRLPLPAGVRGAILARVNRLRAEQRDFLTLAAVIGRRFDLSLLHAASGQEEARVLDGLADLLRTRLIRDVPGGVSFEFSHDKIREVVDQGLDEAHRRHLHAKVGRALEKQAGSSSDDATFALAYHFSQSEDAPRAVKHLRLAGRRAEGLHAYRTALEHYDRAQARATADGLLDPAERLDLIMDRYRCAWLMGAHGLIAAQLAEALPLAHSHPDPRRRAEVDLALGINYISQGSWEEGRSLLQGAVDAAVKAGDPGLEARARQGLTDILMHARQMAEALAHFRRMLEIGQQLQDYRLVGVARWGLSSARPPAERAAVALEVLEGALERGRWDLVIDMGSDLIITLLMAGRAGEAVEQGERVLAAGRRHGLLSLERSLTRALSRARAELGDYELARSLAVDSLRASRASDYRYGEMRALACLALADAGLSSFDEAVLGMQRAAAMAEAMGAWQDLCAFQYQAAEVLLASSRPGATERARQLAEQSLQTADRIGFERAQMVARCYLSEAALRQGSLEAAGGMACQAMTILEARGHADGYEPLVWFTHFLARHALRQPNAPASLARARSLLAGRALAIPDRALRQSYLTRVRLNREICKRTGSGQAD